jgi:aryl-alcohol dehydrogenase-like predicted oxidoreductase
MKTDYIDVFQIHWPDESTPIEETFGAVAKLIDEGKVRAAGVCNFGPGQMEAVNRVVPLTTSQPPFSMVLRDAENDVFPWCAEHEVSTIVYSPLQRGLLTGKFDPDTQFPEGDHRRENPFFKAGNIRRVNAFLEQIKPIAEAHDATITQLVINWTVHHPGVTAALVGARNPRQAEENVCGMGWRLTEDETRQINDLLDGLELDLENEESK